MSPRRPSSPPENCVEVHGDGFRILYDDRSHSYWIAAADLDPVPTPSVTGILGVLDKPALPWWGMMTGLSGIVELARRYDWHKNPPDWSEVDADSLRGWLTSEKLTVNHVRDKAGGRGSAVHKIAERYARDGEMPLPDKLPLADRGYVRAFCRFVLDWDPEFVRTEVIVGSAVHGYAGTFDADARVDEIAAVLNRPEIVDRIRRPLERDYLAGALWRLDYKTTKDLYPETQHPQLEAYDEAAPECGLERADARAVVLLKPDGEYELDFSVASFAEFAAYKDAYDARERIRAKTRKGRKR